jgi:hypothetical protein
MRRNLSMVAALVLCAGAGFWAVTSNAGVPRSKSDLSVKLGNTVLITHSRGYCWVPNIYHLSDGELFVKFCTGPDNNTPESNYSSFCVSNDDGKTWSPRVPQGHLFSAGILLKSRNGESKLIGVGFRLLPETPGDATHLKDSLLEISDGWNSIKQRRWIHLTLPEAPAMKDVEPPTGDSLKQTPEMVFHGCILSSQDGGLLVPMYGKLPGDKYYRVILTKSMDEGLHWTYLSTIAHTDHPWPGMGDEGPNEPGLARLADGRLICLLRTGFDGLMYETWSSDDGKTWDEPVSSGLKGVDPQVRLLSSGVLALTSGRPGPVFIALSMDGTGKTWTHKTDIFKEMSLRYTGWLELSPNHLLVVYDHVPYGWKLIPDTDKTSMNEILGTFIDLE